MDASSKETVTACAERQVSTDEVAVPPTPRRGVVHAFRHAQLQRLEARVERLRRRLHVAPPIHERGVTLVAVDPGDLCLRPADARHLRSRRVGPDCHQRLDAPIHRTGLDADPAGH